MLKHAGALEGFFGVAGGSCVGEGLSKNVSHHVKTHCLKMLKSPQNSKKH